MSVYSRSTTTLLPLLIKLFNRKSTITVAAADDVTTDGEIKDLGKWWDLLNSYGTAWLLSSITQIMDGCERI